MGILKKRKIAKISESIKKEFDECVMEGKRDEVKGINLYGDYLTSLSGELGLDYFEFVRFLDREYNLGMVQLTEKIDGSEED